MTHLPLWKHERWLEKVCISLTEVNQHLWSACFLSVRMDFNGNKFSSPEKSSQKRLLNDETVLVFSSCVEEVGMDGYAYKAQRSNTRHQGSHSAYQMLLGLGY